MMLTIVITSTALASTVDHSCCPELEEIISMDSVAVHLEHIQYMEPINGSDDTRHDNYLQTPCEISCCINLSALGIMPYNKIDLCSEFNLRDSSLLSSDFARSAANSLNTPPPRFLS